MSQPTKPKASETDPFRDRVVTGGSLHDHFQRQIQELLADKGISAEDRQRILTTMSCPCCGGSGASFTVKLKD
jgi:hypothetical protein